MKEIEFGERRKRNSGERGRLKNGEDLLHLFRIKASFEEDEGVIENKMLRKGKFIVATNELDSENLSDEEALKAYKERQYAERGFRFLKDHFFFAHNIFLKNEERIVMMVMIMGQPHTLMVYSLAEHKLREALEKTGETIPEEETNEETNNQACILEGITVFYIGSNTVNVLNLKPKHAKILSLLGYEYEKVYSYG